MDSVLRTYWQPIAVVVVLALFIGYSKLSGADSSSSSAIPEARLGATVSRLVWAFPKEFQGKITLELPRLHEKLGPLIYIGPNEVSFYSLDVYDLVHKVGSKFRKDPRVYGEFVQDGNPALFSITDTHEHSKRRRLMGQLYNRSKMQNLEGLMVHHVDRFIAVFKNHADDINLVPACRALEADIISDFSFGAAIGAIDKFSEHEELLMVAKNDEKATWMPLLTSFPQLCLLWDRIGDIAFNLTGIRTSYRHGIQDFDQWCDTNWHSLKSHEKAKFPNLIQTLINSGLPPQTALAEAKENLGPGTDTTSATLAHILWALAHNQQFQNDLYQDLAQVSFTADMTTLEGVAKLRACVKEGIRWTGAAAAMLPRLVPEGGAELCGQFVPAKPNKTVLTSSPIWYLHDPIAFPEPKLYDPYRWLTPDGSTLKDDALRDKFYIPFSKGANVCMGAHFSYLELYISVSRIVQNFQINVHPQLLSSSYLSMTESSAGRFRRVPLPARKEWVAAVPIDKLLITVSSRKS